MNFTSFIYNSFVLNGIEVSYIAAALLGASLITFTIQLWYYLGKYGPLPRFRNGRGKDTSRPVPPVSVIVVVKESNRYYIEEVLPLILTQEFDRFEVVVVDCSYNDEISELLLDMATYYRHMHVTSIKAQGVSNHSNKLALTVGIKAATYEHLIFTTPDSFPVSQKWLSLMAKGFITADVVIGYCGIEQKKGFANKMIRCSRLFASVRYLSAAIAGSPYRGMAPNLGYTKSIYFGNKGFNHLNMNIGDDDLFLQKFLKGNDVSVVMNPNATVRHIQYGGLGWWYGICRYFSSTFKYYPPKAKNYVRGELWSRSLFFLFAGLSIWLLNWWFWLVPVALLLLRSAAVETKIWRICRRLGEKKLAWIYPLYDIFSPLTSAFLAVVRKFRPNKTVWR